MGVTAGGERLDAETPTIADAFARAGYATAAFGKWHNGTQAPHHPLCRGFDRFYGFTSGHWARYFDPMLDRDGEITRGVGYLPDDVTNEAIRFIEESSDRPFFAWLAFNTPHSPMQAPRRWWSRHVDQQIGERGTLAEREDVDHTRAALAMCENLDWNVGRVVAALERLGRGRDTIVVFLSDNGPNGHRFNGGMRGIKGSTDEGGVRSPLFIRWPTGLDGGRVVAEPAAAIDVAPTLSELCGIEMLDGPPRDGVSLAPLLRDEDAVALERTLFTHWDGRIAARRGGYLYDHEGRLYDFGADPSQMLGVAESAPDVSRRLGEEVSAWRDGVLKQGGDQTRPFVVGHPGLPATQLPARDATTRGGIVRSNRFRNSTYFTNWTSPEDAIVWDVEVAVAGRYRATIYYTCGERDVGSVVELRWRDESCVATVGRPHDPPLVAARRDLVPRREGDMKEFRPLELGEIALSSGRGELELRAESIPGDAAGDFRLLVLRRID